MTLDNEDSPSVTIDKLNTFIITLEEYYRVLLEENRALTEIKAAEVFEIQSKKKDIFIHLEQNHQIIEEIFTILKDRSSKLFPQKIRKIASKKISTLLEKIQVLGRANQALLQSLDKHTNEILKNIAPEKHQITYDHLKRKKL